MYRIYASMGEDETGYEVETLSEEPEELAKTALEAADRFRQEFNWIIGGDIYIDIYRLEEDNTLVIDPVYMDFVSF